MDMSRSSVDILPLKNVLDAAQLAYAVECVFNGRKRSKTGMAQFLLQYAAFLKRRDRITDEDFEAVRLVSTCYANLEERLMS